MLLSGMWEQVEEKNLKIDWNIFALLHHLVMSDSPQLNFLQPAFGHVCHVLQKTNTMVLSLWLEYIKSCDITLVLSEICQVLLLLLQVTNGNVVSLI